MTTLSEEYLTGIKEFDYEHARIIELLGVLKSAIISQPEYTYIILDRILGEWRLHMMAEEMFMLRIEYPELAHHVQEHNRFLEFIKKLRYKVSNHTMRVSAELVEEMRGIVLDHTKEDDKLYGVYYRSSIYYEADTESST